MLIKDLPKEIRDLVSKRRKEQGDNRNIEDCGSESVAKCNKYTRLGFVWDETIEGQGFWQKIQNGNFTEFYEKYPKKESYKMLTQPICTVTLRVIKPLKSLSNSSADSTPWPKVGDITWTSNGNLQFIGIPGTMILLEDNRYFQNFCGGSFEVVSEISSGATDKHIVPIVTDTHSMSSGLRADTSIIGVVGISDVVTEENLTRVLDRYKKNELETLIECETEFKKKNKNRKLI